MSINQHDKARIIVDTSYAVFYRFHATKRWYSFANKEKYKTCENLFLDEIFKAKYKKLFISMFTPLFKKYNSDFNHLIFAIDCPRSKIWRHNHITQYKGTRVRQKGDEAIGDFFKFTYQVIIPEIMELYQTKKIKYDTLEGDDCIYIAKKIIRHKHPLQPIVIIGSDHDLMQLLEPVNTEDNTNQPYTNIITLKDKSLQDKSCGDSQKDLEIKIIVGDKSDNINGCFSRCGYKTALKLVNNTELLQQKFNSHTGSREIYERNKKIISFKGIPKKLYDECYTQYESIL
jgi:5'-3' exonuclease